MKAKHRFKQNQSKETLTRTLRALVADDSLRVEFLDGIAANLVDLNQDLVAEKGRVVVPKSRAACDLAACYLLFHDAALHQDVMLSLSKHDDCEFLNAFEKVRVIACMKDHYRGAAKNILRDYPPLEGGSMSEANRGGVFSFILLAEIFPDFFSPNPAFDFSANIIQEIKNLKNHIYDQEDFALAVARILAMLESKEEQQPQPQEEPKKEEKDESLNQKISSPLNLPGGTWQESKIQDQKSKKDLAGVEVAIKLDVPTPHEDHKIQFKLPYRVYTTKFDEVIFPQKLLSKSESANLRDQLSLRLAKLNAVSKKMSLQLKKKLLAKRTSLLEFDSARGILDRKKLTRLVLDPLLTDIWVNQKNHEYQDTALTILLDNSGSMRGNPIVMSALACEIIAEILERFCVKTEIIGFTTADWKGGRARRLWDSEGRPQNPGRLNELRHIIYKHFNQSFRKAKVNLGLMLKDGVLKENIDGEALLFARSRLMQQSERRKILLVISDGTPVDDST
ncbi:MAG: hypothetical protein FJX34_04110, partial [Alphaproteobacteria bacterium]|nr:hypothetical protein [Alphaproteobacteria bacterium]